MKHLEQGPTAELRSYVTPGAAEVSGLARRIWPCYDEVFGDVADFGTWCAQMFARHAARSGYRLVVADQAGTVVGFAWGCTGERGQFWSDLVARELPGVAAGWVGGHFELVTLGVAPPWRGRGLGRRLHDALLAGAGGRRALLGTTADPADPAVRLYLSSGWRPLGPLGPGRQLLGRPAQQ